MLTAVLVLSWLFLTTEATGNAYSCSGAELAFPDYSSRQMVMLAAVLGLSQLFPTTPVIRNACSCSEAELVDHYYSKRPVLITSCIFHSNKIKTS